MLDLAKRDKLKSRLIKDLKKACGIASHYSGGYSGEFLDAQEFYQALKSAVEAFECGDDSQARDLWIWFAPTTAWDDFIGTEGLDLGNAIFGQLQAYIDKHCIKI
ncbi:hypothetical protein [Microbulbifer yueqingensis]|uniref:hypothetical protein n=1 Tax=Microbulbifer yueqingensis TaxID=658219 RepID=UPI000B82C1CC|nr:hypothetical protein [Microbulbifer yueqingensis]